MAGRRVDREVKERGEESSEEEEEEGDTSNGERSDSLGKLDEESFSSLSSDSSSSCSSGEEDIVDHFFPSSSSSHPSQTTYSKSSPPLSSGVHTPHKTPARTPTRATRSRPNLRNRRRISSSSPSPSSCSSFYDREWIEKRWWGGGLCRGVPVPEVLSNYPARLCGVELSPFEELKSHWYEIGSLAFWRLSSAKDGSGVCELRDNCSQTFWQSDGSAPHTITLTFNRLMKISRVDLLLNLQIDESYTPRIVQIKVGDALTSLHLAREAEYHPPPTPPPPSGGAAEDEEEEGHAWWSILLTPPDALRARHGGYLPFEEETGNEEELLMIKKRYYDYMESLEYIRGFCLQISVLRTFHEGRDTHIRQV
ncbi:anaphase-promoting complex subunit variant 1 [Cystoisospora suis]|uniref:Anaphase-promoting complex subunit variant 1 n=1 Tax=Cystoisospora suis TaxID=483139 RepID=A0A2C6KX06_9APIC|nr:anaphase-promoting complex subunit variant 1 [Cystoisospora suis]